MSEFYMQSVVFCLDEATDWILSIKSQMVKMSRSTHYTHLLHVTGVWFSKKRINQHVHSVGQQQKLLLYCQETIKLVIFSTQK